MSAGLNRYVPFSTGGEVGTNPYCFRSGFNGGSCLDDDMLSADYPRDQLKQAIAEGNRIRKYYLGDFFALTKVTTDPKDWCAMQYHRPEHADGMVLVFRRHDAVENRKTLSLREIEASADYEVTLSYGFEPSETVRMKGSKLKDIETEIADRPGSLLVEYKRVM